MYHLWMYELLGSIYTDRNKTKNTWFLCQVLLFQTDFDDPNELKGLLAQFWNAAVLDSCASKTVCSQARLDNYVDSLNENEKTNSQFLSGSSTNCLRDRKQCNEKAQLPANKRSHQIITDLTDSDIPPLLSRASMS